MKFRWSWSIWGIPHVMALERRKHIQKSHINGKHLWFKKIQEGKKRCWLRFCRWTCMESSTINRKWWDSSIWPRVCLHMWYTVYPQVPNLWQLEREVAMIINHGKMGMVHLVIGSYFPWISIVGSSSTLFWDKPLIQHVQVTFHAHIDGGGGAFKTCHEYKEDSTSSHMRDQDPSQTSNSIQVWNVGRNRICNSQDNWEGTNLHPCIQCHENNHLVFTLSSLQGGALRLCRQWIPVCYLPQINRTLSSPSSSFTNLTIIHQHSSTILQS